MTRLWLKLVTDAVRHRGHWPALWRAYGAIRRADIALAQTVRRNPIPAPWGHQVPGRIG